MTSRPTTGLEEEKMKFIRTISSFTKQRHNMNSQMEKKKMETKPRLEEQRLWS